MLKASQFQAQFAMREETNNDRFFATAGSTAKKLGKSSRSNLILSKTLSPLPSANQGSGVLHLVHVIKRHTMPEQTRRVNGYILQSRVLNRARHTTEQQPQK